MTEAISGYTYGQVQAMKSAYEQKKDQADARGYKRGLLRAAELADAEAKIFRKEDLPSNAFTLENLAAALRKEAGEEGK